MKGIKKIARKVFTIRTLIELCVGLALLNPESDTVEMFFMLGIFATLMVLIHNELDKFYSKEES